MEVQHRSSHPSRRDARLAFQYSLLLTPVLSAKFLHLYSHITSIPILLYLLYLPTFLALDVVNALLFWIIVHISSHRRWNILITLTRCTLVCLVLAAAAVQIAFFMETGGEIKWKAAKSLTSDPDGLKVVLTGAVQAMFVALLLIAIAFAISQPLYSMSHFVFSTAFRICGGKRHLNQRLTETEAKSAAIITSLTYISDSSESDDDEICLTSRRSMDLLPYLTDPADEQPSNLWTVRFFFMAPLIVVCALFSVRPPHFPYPHMSASLPFTLCDIWNPVDMRMCATGHSEDFPPYPLDHLITKDLWEKSGELHDGWRPMINLTAAYQRENLPTRPSWLPDIPFQGLQRWYSSPRHEVDDTSTGHINELEAPNFPGRHMKHHPGGSSWSRHHRSKPTTVDYNPVTDPMRITNLDQALLLPVSEAVKQREVKIKHVFLIALESTRKDVFPFKKGSHLHQKILDTYRQSEDTSTIDEQLAQLSENAEVLTGEKSGFAFTGNASVSSGSWRNVSHLKGGLNVQGGMTGSTTSLKSMLESHCGVQPLAVDFTVEAGRQIYQPCFPSIFKLFNADKDTNNTYQNHKASQDFTQLPWRSVYVQAITDQFDHQDKINEQVGFDELVVKSTLLDPLSSHYPPMEKQSNYFGFPETQVKPYIRDAIQRARTNGERLFLSHLTSTTHHPWNLPEGSEHVHYLKKRSWTKERELNRYLNTVRYVDNWIGEIMDLLDEMDVAEETLVVLVGDHGMAFEEDSRLHTTYENGHISNMKVPLTFYHPSLPRVQLRLNATSLSIIPTVLDLLISTASLNKQDRIIAQDLAQQYEGQSLIRPYLKEKNGRQAWNIAVLNAGGALLSVSSAAVPFRLVMPICKAGVYRFTSNDVDPHEQKPVEGNSIAELIKNVASSYGIKTAAWIAEAEKIGKYWVLEQRRRWRYDGASLQDDRKPEEMRGAGAVKKQHWWNT